MGTAPRYPAGRILARLERIGRYEVVRELGQGGMGRVFLGRDPELERNVALKLLHREDSQQRTQFRREARALAALSHPNIVTIFEIGDHEDQRFIAMEYLEGRPLRDLLTVPELVPSREALVAICAQIVEAVKAAHTAGILHRDLKPENVIVSSSGAVKVVDFGIAHRLGGKDSLLDRPTLDHAAAVTAVVDILTETQQLAVTAQVGVATLATESPLGPSTHTLFGTPAYMPPEVLLGEGSTPASDVYSLGVMLYECLVGRRPYHTSRLFELIALVVDGKETPAPIIDPLGPLILRMLAATRPRGPDLPRSHVRSPSRRPHSADDRSQPSLRLP